MTLQKLLLATLTVVALSALAMEANGFTIGLPESVRTEQHKPQLERAFVSIYNDLEEDIEFAYLPINRMMMMMDNHQLDAIAYKLNTQFSRAKDLVKVPEPITQLSLFLECIDELTCNLDKRGRFAVVDDAIYITQLCERENLQCLALNNINLARKALKDGIVDALISQRTPHIEERCLETDGISVHPILNTTINIYHYLAAEHRDLAEPLAEKVRQYKRSLKRPTKHCNDLSNVTVSF